MGTRRSIDSGRETSALSPDWGRFGEGTSGGCDDHRAGISGGTVYRDEGLHSIVVGDEWVTGCSTPQPGGDGLAVPVRRDRTTPVTANVCGIAPPSSRPVTDRRLPESPADRAGPRPPRYVRPLSGGSRSTRSRIDATPASGRRAAWARPTRGGRWARRPQRTFTAWRVPSTRRRWSPAKRAGAVGLDGGSAEVVGTAADGDEVVTLADQTVPDVVVADVGMPQLDGVEATRRITAGAPGMSDRHADGAR